MFATRGTIACGVFFCGSSAVRISKKKITVPGKQHSSGHVWSKKKICTFYRGKGSLFFETMEGQNEERLSQRRTLEVPWIESLCSNYFMRFENSTLNSLTWKKINILRKYLRTPITHYL